ncbi:hypothetical protein [Marisediminicola senii]|uniref:hypothetical protein n=1 Tax=Marisediminicola senii TaxID=2711233 RepID=UPI0013ED2933|nr:hypothetical protein [Marisediminicola senii]
MTDGQSIDGAADGADAPHGWFTFEEHLWHRVWVGLGRLVAGLYLLQGLLFAAYFMRAVGVPLITGIGVIVGLIIAVPVLTMFVVNARWPMLEVNLDTSELRANDTVIPLARVNRAVVKAQPSRTQFTYQLRLSAVAGSGAGSGRAGSGRAGSGRAGSGAAGTVRAQVTLRDRHGVGLDRDAAHILAEALRRTTIELPVAPEDPKGRFARANFPTHITRDQAVSLTVDPPSTYQDLPIVT